MVKHIEIIDANTSRTQVLVDGKPVPGMDSLLADSMKVLPLGPCSEVHLALIADRVTISSSTPNLGTGA